MAWNTSLIIMVRNLVNDLGTTEEFTDERIEEAVAVAAMLVISDYDFETDYTVDLETPNISPDPVTTGDTLAIALFSLKAACILDLGKVEGRFNQMGVKVKDGDSEVTTSEGLKGYDSVLQLGSCGSYAKLVDSSRLEDASGQGVAVFGPYGTGQTYNGYEGNWSSARSFFDGFFRL